MESCDEATILVAHAILGAFFVVSALMDLLRTLRKPRARLEAQRGDLTMNALYFMYGIATLVFATAIDSVGRWAEFRVTVLFADYAVLTYLFFFSYFARNRVLIPLIARASRD